MAAITFDALKHIKTLEDAGIPRKQAEAFIAVERETFIDAVAAARESVAKKEEIAGFKSEFSGDFKTLRADFKTLRADFKGLENAVDAKIAIAKLDIIKWLVGTVVGAVTASTIAIIIAIIKFVN